MTAGAPTPSGDGDNGAVTTFYDEIGGEETITAIVAAFYRGVVDNIRAWLAGATPRLLVA